MKVGKRRMTGGGRSCDGEETVFEGDRHLLESGGQRNWDDSRRRRARSKNGG